MEFLTFQLNGHEFGLELSVIDEVVRAVAIAPLPGAPAVVEGVIDVRGEVLPVLAVRARFGLPARPVQISDVFILARHAAGRIALHVDRVGWPLEAGDTEIEPVPQLAAGSPFAKSVVRTSRGVLVIHDLEKFLSNDEVMELRRALDEARGEAV